MIFSHCIWKTKIFWDQDFDFTKFFKFSYLDLYCLLRSRTASFIDFLAYFLGGKLSWRHLQDVIICFLQKRLTSSFHVISYTTNILNDVNFHVYPELQWLLLMATLSSCFLSKHSNFRLVFSVDVLSNDFTNSFSIDFANGLRFHVNSFTTFIQKWIGRDLSTHEIHRN